MGRGLTEHAQSIHKAFSQSIHTALTRAVAKHSQEHSRSSYKNIHKALARTSTKVPQRNAQRLVQVHSQTSQGTFL